MVNVSKKIGWKNQHYNAISEKIGIITKKLIKFLYSTLE